MFNIDETVLSLASGSNVVEKPLVFKYESTDFIENIFCHYNTESLKEFNSHLIMKEA